MMNVQAIYLAKLYSMHRILHNNNNVFHDSEKRLKENFDSIQSKILLLEPSPIASLKNLSNNNNNNNNNNNKGAKLKKRRLSKNFIDEEPESESSNEIESFFLTTSRIINSKESDNNIVKPSLRCESLFNNNNGSEVDKKKRNELIFSRNFDLYQTRINKSRKKAIFSTIISGRKINEKELKLKEDPMELCGLLTSSYFKLEGNSNFGFKSSLNFENNNGGKKKTYSLPQVNEKNSNRLMAGRFNEKININKLIETFKLDCFANNNTNKINYFNIKEGNKRVFLTEVKEPKPKKKISYLTRNSDTLPRQPNQNSLENTNTLKHFYINPSPLVNAFSSTSSRPAHNGLARLNKSLKEKEDASYSLTSSVKITDINQNLPMKIIISDKSQNDDNGIFIAPPCSPLHFS